MKDSEGRMLIWQSWTACRNACQLARHMLDAELKLEAQDSSGTRPPSNAPGCCPQPDQRLRLELKVRLLQRQPEALLALTEKLLKADATGTGTARSLPPSAYTQQLSGMVDSREVRNWLRKVPDAERQNAQLVAAVVARLIKVEDFDFAATLLSTALADSDQATPELGARAVPDCRATDPRNPPWPAPSQRKAGSSSARATRPC